MYLYVKTHNITGLKYLGKTINDPYKYKGSGTHWVRHLKKYGEDVTTEVLLETDDKELLKEKGIYYSNLWNVVKSKEWANIVIEQGDGGDTSKSLNHIISMKNKDVSGQKNSFYGKHHSEETKLIISKKNKGRLKGKKQSSEHIEKRKCSGDKNGMYGKTPWNKGQTGLQKQSTNQLLKKSKPLIFENKIYISLNEAEKTTGISSYKISKKCQFISAEEYLQFQKKSHTL